MTTTSNPTITVCPTCSGAGALPHHTRNPELITDCPSCDGHGHPADVPCGRTRPHPGHAFVDDQGRDHHCGGIPPSPTDVARAISGATAARTHLDHHRSTR